MPGGKETRLLHLSEMEKLDKTLFRLEQGGSGSGAAASSASSSSSLGPGERETAGSSLPSSGSIIKGAQPAVVFSLFLFFFPHFFPFFNMKQFPTCLLPLQNSVGSSYGSV